MDTEWQMVVVGWTCIEKKFDEAVEGTALGMFLFKKTSNPNRLQAADGATRGLQAYLFNFTFYKLTLSISSDVFVPFYRSPAPNVSPRAL